SRERSAARAVSRVGTALGRLQGQRARHGGRRAAARRAEQRRTVAATGDYRVTDRRRQRDYVVHVSTQPSRHPRERERKQPAPAAARAVQPRRPRSQRGAEGGDDSPDLSCHWMPTMTRLPCILRRALLAALVIAPLGRATAQSGVRFERTGYRLTSLGQRVAVAARVTDRQRRLVPGARIRW